MFRRFRVACATRRADKLVHFLLRECSRRESAAVDAVYHYDLPCEKANQENLRISGFLFSQERVVAVSGIVQRRLPAEAFA